MAVLGEGGKSGHQVGFGEVGHAQLGQVLVEGGGTGGQAGVGALEHVGQAGGHPGQVGTAGRLGGGGRPFDPLGRQPAGGDTPEVSV